MFKNYLTLTLRNLLKFKVYSVITISGLAIALASCFLIYSYVLDELSFDRYHEKASQIYRVVYGADKIVTTTPFILAPALMNDFPEIIKSVRVSQITPILIKKNDNWIPENEFICADQDFFNIYTLPLIKGDPQNVLTEPFSVVITKEIAQKYFGDQVPSGKILSIQIDKDVYDLKITGLLDHFPRNSHFRADLIASMAVEELIFSKLEKRMSSQFGYQISLLNSWDASSFFTYLLLSQEHNAFEWDKKFNEFEKRHFSGNRAFNFKLQSLTDIHLHTPDNEQGNIKYLYLFSAIALFILLVACVNFIILSTAQSITRLKEMGLRKVLGADRFDLIKQVLGEAMLTTFMALPFAVMFIELVRPVINQLLAIELTSSYFHNWQFIFGAVIITAFVGIGSGSFIAFYVSAFQPAEILKAKMSQISSRSYFKKGLIITQLLIFIAMITCSLLFYRQFYYLHHKELGFNKNNLISFDIPNAEFKQNYLAFKNEIKKNPDVLNVSAAFDVPPSESGVQFEVNTLDDPDNKKNLKALFVDYDYLETIEANLVVGRFFSKQYAVDSDESILLNESAVQELGIKEPATGRMIFSKNLSRTKKIIGVIKDYHESSLHSQISPMLFMIMPDQNRQIVIRVSPKNMSSTVEYISDIYKKFAPEEVFNYRFIAAEYDQLYRSEEKLGKIIGSFTMLAILLTCLGLFGLSMFMSERRTKEIGIRKVLGASDSEIVLMLTKDFSKLIIIACVIAWPIAYYIMNQWLQNFAYRISMNGWYFILAGILALGIALCTVSYQSIKAAVANPVKSLRYE